MDANIYTCNTLNGSSSGGYHELHTATNLSGIDHLIATVNSIIMNNLIYGNKDTTLTDVLVECRDKQAVQYISEHWQDIFRYPNVRVIVSMM